LSYYPRDEQETHYLYDPSNGNWRVYSTYPPHIRRILSHAHVTNEHKDSDGRVIAVEGIADSNQVRLFKPRL
jgi:hypothetical protein